MSNLSSRTFNALYGLLFECDQSPGFPFTWSDAVFNVVGHNQELVRLVVDGLGQSVDNHSSKKSGTPNIGQPLPPFEAPIWV